MDTIISSNPDKDFPLFDRDLSWLTFNYRVLLEAEDQAVPPIERLRFAAIFSSNLDEFFRVRVAGLRNLARIDKKKINRKIDLVPKDLLHAIHKEVGIQLNIYGKVLNKILSELRQKGVFINYSGKILPKDRKTLNDYFSTSLMGYLQIQSFNSKSLFLDNRSLYFLVFSETKDKTSLDVVNIPSNKISRFYEIRDKQSRFYFIDDIIRDNMSLVFPDKRILGCYSIKLNKDADLQIDDEYEGDLVRKIESQIKKRNLGAPSRLLFDRTLPQDLLKKIKDVLDLDESDLYAGGRYHNLNDFFQISSPLRGLEYEKIIPVRNKTLDAASSVFEAIEGSDQILHFPYQSYNYILRFFNEAAIHPEVKSIYVTFYRMAENSMIGEALISAAKNGKSVNIFMEVKARFDEQNNLTWARKMEAVGIKIHYSIPGLKVHAKAALITMKSQKGKVRRYGFYGTGNLNESTARIYCDHSLLTADQEMNKELKRVFDFLNTRKKPEKFRHLIVSQFGALERFHKLIDQEIRNHKAGKQAEIIIKLNNLEEKSLIEKLYEASGVGVKVTLIVRSICCLVPDTAGIKVMRIVDRFLEHARIFYFLQGGEEAIFMGSSDWMNRNLHRRVEVTVPIYDEGIKMQMKDLLMMQIKDNSKAVVLDSKLRNVKKDAKGTPRRAQMDTYQYIKKINKG